jgi:hypothetical protein
MADIHGSVSSGFSEEVWARNEWRVVMDELQAEADARAELDARIEFLERRQALRQSQVAPTTSESTLAQIANRGGDNSPEVTRALLLHQQNGRFVQLLRIWTERRQVFRAISHQYLWEIFIASRTTSFLRHFRGDPDLDGVMNGDERDALSRVISLLENHRNDPAELEAALHANYEAYENISHYNVDARLEILENNQRERQSQFVPPTPERLIVQIGHAMFIAAMSTQNWANWRALYTAQPTPRVRRFYLGDGVSETVRLQILGREDRNTQLANYLMENNAMTA